MALSQPATSQHLGILRNAGLVSGQHVPRPEIGGSWRLYRLEPEGIAVMREQYAELLNRLLQAALLEGRPSLEDQIAADYARGEGP